MSTATKEQKHAEYLRNREKYMARARRWAQKNPKKRQEILKKWNSKAVDYKRNWRQKAVFNNVIEKKECERCGVEPTDIGKLIIHHNDGNNGKMGKPLNNARDNLVVLCKSCHPRVHYRGEIRELVA